MPSNPASILDTVKKALNLDVGNNDFDLDVTMHINSVFGFLRQMGIGPSDGFVIEDNTTLWSNYTTNIVKLAPIKTYMFLKIRLWFDPPQAAKTIDAMERQIVELEARLNMIGEEINPPNPPPIRPRHTFQVIGDLIFEDGFLDLPDMVDGLGSNENLTNIIVGGDAST
jgi:hypothetical protein